MDLAELVANNRYQAVQDYFDMLPSYSRTWSKILKSEDEVAAMMDLGYFDDTDKTPVIDHSEYTPLIEAVYQVVDQLGVRNQGKKWKPVPRPRLEMVDAVRESRDRQFVDDTAKLFGF